VGDADGDGRLDLYVTNWGPNVLFRNRGDRTFENVTAAAGVAASGWSTGCTFFDADADGDLDLYVARYVETTWDSVAKAQRTMRWRGGPQIMVGPTGLPGEADLFFENVGHGRFAEATDRHGLTDRSRAYGYGVVATDYDDDGFVDLFVANDSNPNFLYHNLGNGRFESVGLEAGVAVNGDGRAQAGMGADAGDYDGDSRVDLLLTTFAHDRYTLYRSVDGRHFEDASAAGIAAPTFVRMGWGAAFLDADLDRRLDLFFANGHIFADVDKFPQLGETYRQKNQLFLNLGGGRFRDVSDRAGAGLQLAAVGRGLAVGDLDNDGDVDIVVNNMDAAPTLLENRQQTRHHWLAVRAAAPAGNRFAIGAKVTVTGGGTTQMREIRSGGSFLSQNDLRAYFGLGDYAGPVDVEIRMPGGRRWEWKQLPSDRLHLLTLAESGGHPATSSSPMNPEYAPRTRRLLLAGALSTLAVVVASSTGRAEWHLPTRARRVRSAATIRDTARAGKRRLSVGAPGQGDRGAAARVVRCASWRRIPGNRRRQSRARCRFPGCAAAADRRRHGRSIAARGEAGDGSAARGDARRSRVCYRTAAAARRVSRCHHGGTPAHGNRTGGFG
jgi:hypothetical protein